MLNFVIEIVFKIALLAFFAAAAIAAHAQQQTNARLQLTNLDQLEAAAQDVVEVNIDGKLLDTAKRVLIKTGDKDAQKIAQAVSGLTGIYVRVYNFADDAPNAAQSADDIRRQLAAPGWERIANVRSKRNNQKVDVFTRFDSDRIGGMAVVVSEARSVAVVNIVGSVDLDLLAEIGGKLNIPKIEIEKDSNAAIKP